jgi:23S rRNA pseudouridine1911/1915/1917 synthase
MEIARTLRLAPDRGNVRLDLYISQSVEGLTRSFVQKLITDGCITVNGEVAKASHKVRADDAIVINVPAPEGSPTLTAEDIPLSILYEDDDVLIVDKPAGIAVYPAPGHPSHTLMNAVLSHCPDISLIDGSVRPGVVHRLDKNTSGVMMVAKSKAAQLDLSAQLKGRRVLKKYLILVKGHPSPDQGVIEAPIGRHFRDRKRMSVAPGGRQARTLYRVIRRLDGYSLVEAILQTGRTHQIRVHFAHRGWPVAGDATYGVRVGWLERQFVHASRLGFHLPSSSEWTEFSSRLPLDLEEALEKASQG